MEVETQEREGTSINVAYVSVYYKVRLGIAIPLYGLISGSRDVGNCGFSQGPKEGIQDPTWVQGT